MWYENVYNKITNYTIVWRLGGTDDSLVLSVKLNPNWENIPIIVNNYYAVSIINE